MNRISVAVAKAYFLDRVKELRNQVPNGDPFVFLGMSAVFEALRNFEQSCVFLEYTHFGPMYSYMSKVAELMENFSLTLFGRANSTVKLSHDNSKHLTCDTTGAVILAAEPCLDWLEERIHLVFDSQNKDLNEVAEEYFNGPDKLFGYN
jgi:hypothetical protein